LRERGGTPTLISPIEREGKNEPPNGIRAAFLYGVLMGINKWFERLLIMKNRDILSSLFWIGFGILFCIGAVQNGIMLSPGVPGPGCLAFIVGSVLIGLSFLVLVPALFKIKDLLGNQEKFFPQNDSLRKLLIALLSLLAYALVLEPFGFFTTTFLFLILVLRLIEPQRWAIVFSFALVTTCLAYALFAALKVELPRGVWGI
jgi:hypothetical protein